MKPMPPITASSVVSSAAETSRLFIRHGRSRVTPRPRSSLRRATIRRTIRTSSAFASFSAPPGVEMGLAKGFPLRCIRWSSAMMFLRLEAEHRAPQPFRLNAPSDISPYPPHRCGCASSRERRRERSARCRETLPSCRAARNLHALGFRATQNQRFCYESLGHRCIRQMQSIGLHAVGDPHLAAVVTYRRPSSRSLVLDRGDVQPAPWSDTPIQATSSPAMAVP